LNPNGSEELVLPHLIKKEIDINKVIFAESVYSFSTPLGSGYSCFYFSSLNFLSCLFSFFILSTLYSGKAGSLRRPGQERQEMTSSGCMGFNWRLCGRCYKSNTSLFFAQKGLGFCGRI